MSKSFKENIQSQIGNLVEVQTRNGFQKIGLLLSAELPDRKITWRDQFQGLTSFKWGFFCLRKLVAHFPIEAKKDACLVNLFRRLC